VRDADGNLASSTLDQYNLNAATTTNALNQTTAYTYEYSNGKPKTTYDLNGRVYTTSYDGLGRPLSITEPDPSNGSSVTKTTYAYTDSITPGATSILQTDYLSSSTSTPTYIYFDGLNRKIQQRKQAEGNNTYAVNDWTYNNVGLLGTESLPYFASSTARSSATTTGKLFTSYTYDALRRTLTIANAVGTTSNAYDRWTVTTTDANGTPKDLVKDAYGNLANVVEHIGTSSYATTTYTRDLNKSLTNITDALGNIRNFTYDGLGRRLSAQDLHASTDTTFGSWSFSYDAANNLTSQTDPKNQTTNFTYDVLNRKLTEDYTGQSGTEISYTYDTCNDGKSRLCIASSTESRITYNYNPLGLQSSASSTINGTSTAFVTQVGYDRQGNQTSITYPDNAQVQYNYNSAGLVDAVLEKENSGSFAYIINNIDYSPLNQITVIQYPNGATTTNTYDPNALYRLTQKQTCVGGCSVVGGGTQTFTTSSTWTAPTGVTSVTVDMWGAGGGGDSHGQVGGGAGAYVHATVSVIPGNVYTVSVGTGGQGGQASAGGSGGTGYMSGGSGSRPTSDDAGGGGGGSSAFAYSGGTLTACAGAGGGWNTGTQQSATSTSGGSGGSGTLVPGITAE
jgi:YD repeat-containing protein